MKILGLVSFLNIQLGTGKEECRNCEALDKSVVKATAFKLSKSNQLAFCKKAIEAITKFRAIGGVVDRTLHRADV